MASRCLLTLLLVLTAGIFDPVLAAAAPSSDLPVVNVGVVIDGPYEGNPYVWDLTRKEILALTEDEFDVRFPEEYYIESDWSLDGAVESLNRLMADPGVDLVITWGILGSQATCCMVERSKPVIAPVILDVELQGVPYEGGTSGVHNLSYVALPDTLADELQRLREVFPFDSVVVISTAAVMDAIPDLEQRTRNSVAEMDIELRYVTVGFSAQEALEAIPSGVDAVFMYPQFQLSREERTRLIDGLIERQLLSFTALGEEFVEDGILAGFGAADFFPRVARRIGVNTQRILLGEDAGSIPVEISLQQQLVINMRTARTLGVSPTYEALLEAKVLHTEPLDVIRSLTLADAVHEAVAVNLDLLARQRAVAAGEENIRRASSVFWPQLDVGAVGLAIDEDRAIASFGSQPERSVTGSAELSQLLFSDDALANKSIQNSLQMGREWDYESLRLDIALEAGTTYLNLLRAKSLLQVQRNNVALTRSHLELARIRRRIGAANPAEVFRWESQIAADRKALVEAEAKVKVAEVAVNRLLHHPLEEPFLTEDVDLRNPWRVTGDPRIADYIATPDRFRNFRDFMVQEGFTASPELKTLAAAIEAQERLVTNTKRAFWTPLIAAQFSFDEFLSKSGEGTDPPVFPGGQVLPTPDDSSWSLGLSASFPLFTGWARKADQIQAEEELEQLRLDHDSVSDKIEQRIRSAMELARASRMGIGLARESSTAAGKNLELVSDAYARGAVSIIDLLDAQNAALNAEELATNSVYDHLIDLLEVERSVSRMQILGTPETAREFFEQLEGYFRGQGMPLPQPQPN